MPRTVQADRDVYYLPHARQLSLDDALESGELGVEVCVVNRVRFMSGTVTQQRHKCDQHDVLVVWPKE